LRADPQFPPFGTALGCVFFGLILAGLAFFLYQFGTPDVPRNEIVTLTDAKVERAYRRCSRSTCWPLINIESGGKHLELLQYDTVSARATIDALRAGDTITALASQVSVRPEELWFWEIRRAGEILLSNEQTLKDELARNHRSRLWSFLVGGISTLLLVIGVFTGIKQGVWRTAA
jgi:hypothetical protein